MNRLFFLAAARRSNGSPDSASNRRDKKLLDNTRKIISVLE
jgi:hypothetical protein